MYPSRTAVRRLVNPSLVPWPQKIVHRPPNPRLFTLNSQLLLISSSTPRPQLPFLHSPSSIHPSRYLARHKFQLQISRLLTTERKRYIKEQLRTATKWTLYFWTAAALLSVIIFGVENERLEREFPSPRDWSWGSRWQYRTTRGQERLDKNPNELIDWPKTGEAYLQLLRRLEDAQIDGDGLHSSLGFDGEIYVQGVGTTGLDVSMKSEQWRKGYYECLRGAARAAEHLDTWVRDRTRNIAFPSEVVIGPSNPRPRPVSYGSKPAPLEENCEPAFESPEVYYIKILTTKGFNTGQRLNAALAYADWLDFKGLPSSAENMYGWSLDIALDALPVGVNNVVDNKTGVIHEKAVHITPNIILATTALATHHAKNGNFATALPIFLSILRAQRNLPPPSAKSRALQATSSSTPESDPSTFSIITSLLRSMIISPPYPDPEPSGDTLSSCTPTAICEEAGTMAHIGEILFASSSKPSVTQPLISHPSMPTRMTSAQSSGLAWTRSSVALAQETLLSLSSSPSLSPPSRPYPAPEAQPVQKSSPDTALAKQRCTECLLSSMKTWKLMVAELRSQETFKQHDTLTTHTSQPAPKGWFWNSSHKEDADAKGRWEQEVEMVEAKAREVEMLVRQEGWMKGEGGTERSGVLGFA